MLGQLRHRLQQNLLVVRDAGGARGTRIVNRLLRPSLEQEDCTRDGVQRDQQYKGAPGAPDRRLQDGDGVDQPFPRIGKRARRIPHVSTGKSSSGVQRTCQAYPGNSPSTPSRCIQTPSQSNNRCAGSPSRSAKPSEKKSTGSSPPSSSGRSSKPPGSQTRCSSRRKTLTSCACASTSLH